MPTEDSTPEEIWKTITEFPDYMISNLSRVKRIAPGPGTRAGKILHPAFENHGYLVVRLCRSEGGNRVAMRRYLHHLVAQAFIGPRPKGFCVNHKSGIKTDNSPRNLEYVTRAENGRHAFVHGLVAAPPVLFGEKHPNSKVVDKDVREIRFSSESYRALAIKFGVSKTTVRCIKKRKTWIHIL